MAPPSGTGIVFIDGTEVWVYIDQPWGRTVGSDVGYDFSADPDGTIRYQGKILRYSNGDPVNESDYPVSEAHYTTSNPTANGAYIGASGVARKVKKIYVGVNGTARKVKKAYIGVGGVARLCFAGGVDPVLGNNDPATIQAVAQSGQASNYWAIGDTVPITLNGTVGALTFSNETYYAFIIGFNHNSGIEGTNTIHFQFGKTNDGTDIAFESGYNGIYNNNESARFVMNTTDTNTGGWYNSYMRKTICPEFLGALPADWQNIIVPCTKYSDNTGRSNDTASNVTSTQDKIWLLAEFEVSGERKRANSAEQNYQKQYDYYKNSNSRKKKRAIDITEGSAWWLRSVCVGSTTRFIIIEVTGSSYRSSASWSYGFAPGFIVA